MTVPAGGSEAGSTPPTGGAPQSVVPPYSVPGVAAGPIGTGVVGTGASTGAVSMPTGYGAHQKRYEMRGLKEERNEKDRRGYFWG